MADIDIQIASEATPLPSEDDFRLWCESALQSEHKGAALAIRVVDEAEMQSLNAQFRMQDKPTNVLSFPCQLPEELDLHELGDVIICAQVVKKEASEQNKAEDAHWAHMAVHGVLHLQGYDHIEEIDADLMEALEEKIITSLGYPKPYNT